MLHWPLAFALPEDSAQDMDIYSDTYEFDFQNSTTTFIGNVILNQGSLKINADKIVYFGKLENGKAAGSGKIVATGKPARFQQTPKVDTLPVTAIANRLEYSIKNETLFLIEDASLDQDGTSLSGNRIEYDVKRALVKASSKIRTFENEGRVRLVIPPKTFQNIEN